MRVDITPVADAPIVDISGSASVTQLINSNNATTTTNGFTITAYKVDGTLSTIANNTSPVGFGVAGATSGATDAEIGANTTTQSEKLVVKFDQAVSFIDVSFAYKHSNGVGETAKVNFIKMVF